MVGDLVHRLGVLTPADGAAPKGEDLNASGRRGSAACIYGAPESGRL